ncbi:MAG: response regulator [Bacteroidales bacterium]|nr:response regulator [Bacteroidales bacterium]
MKKTILFSVSLVAFLLSLNVFSFLNVNSRFISFLNSSIEQQAVLCGIRMEEELDAFENDLNKLLFNYNFSMIFKDREQLENREHSLELFYSKYRHLITQILIYDDNRNYFGLYLNEDDNFVIDTFSRQRQQNLSPRDKVERKENKFLYYFPYFEGDKVSGNLIVEVDIEKFTDHIFSLYPEDRTISWKWVLTSDAKILTNNFFEPAQVGSLHALADSIDELNLGTLRHEVADTTGKTFTVHSSYYPLTIFNKRLGIIFSANQSEFNRYFIYKNLGVAVASFFIYLGLIAYLLYVISRRNRKIKIHQTSENLLSRIIENFPVGIMVLDDKNIIRSINSTAQSMLFVEKTENLVGKDFTRQFLLSNKFLNHDDNESGNNIDYLYYDKDGVETVIFRMEQVKRIGEEELRLIALIDVSTIERSRKQEMAANHAKSDFLASMSHEIRTPMNGILGMVSDLLQAELPEKEKEKVQLIKKSSDLLMTIINDILDFSKIEAGKMMLEEIPFRLSEEISIVVGLFDGLAAEKGLKIETAISKNIPDKLIGDPFRLRQVFSNLVSNAIKFTEQGKIVIGADLLSTDDYRLRLLFRVEDTGIGIPSDKINTIFNNYSQTRGSISRKYGGTGLGIAISKQLVELMNGEIRVESPSGISISDDAPGSKFIFTITVYSSEKIEKEFDHSSITALDRITALMITKEPDPAKSNVYKWLKKFGVKIIARIYQESTLDALMHHIKTKHNDYQLLVMADKNHMDGFSVANKMKDKGLADKFPIIMVSNDDQVGNYKISRKLHIDHYLVEPLESKELYDILCEIFVGLEDQKTIAPILNSLPGNLKILLAEDNIINQKVAKSIFKNIGYEIELAENGAVAVEMADRKEYDIIFMDLYMPELDGFEATEILRKKGIKTPIIAMSAESNDELKADSVLAGMDDYIDKPVKIETVKQLLIKLFSSSVK